MTATNQIPQRRMIFAALGTVIFCVLVYFALHRISQPPPPPEAGRALLQQLGSGE
jgi:hypothetical protein